MKATLDGSAVQRNNTPKKSEVTSKATADVRVMHIRCTFIRPMLMHSPRLIDPTDEISKKVKALQKKNKELKKKQDTSDIEAEILRLQFIGSTYWDESVNKFYIPCDNVEAVIKAGAMKSRLGKQAEAGITIESEDGCVYLQGIDVEGTLEDYYAQELKKLPDGGQIFNKPVRIPPRTGARVMCHRMMIPRGAFFEADVVFTTDMFSEVDLKKAIENAGKFCGLGVWRPKFGRFVVEFVSVKDYVMQ